MTTPIISSENDTDRPLFDLSGLVAGIRWRRRLWASLALVGLLLGLAAAAVLPTRASATADVFVTHENEASGDGQSLMKTDLALLQTTTVAAVAVDSLKINMTPESFVSTYAGAIVADNILEITARGADDAEAMARVQAVADAFITVHVKQSADAAEATVKAYTDRRDQVQKELDGVNTQIAATSSGADIQTLYNRRGSLASQIASLTQQAEAASIGSPQVAAGTKILDAPHRTSHGFLLAVALYGGIGLFAGLALGFLIAAVAAVVRNRPVLRRDIVAHLGASVVAQIPAPLRGPRKLIRRTSAEKERARTAATLVRLVRESPKPVSVLELGCARAAAALVKDMAVELSTERTVILVDDLPGDEMTAALGPDTEVELVPGTEFPPSTPSPRDNRARQLAIGTVRPGTPWTDLRRLGAEALVVVRAGKTDATWLHTVARQLADAGIAIIGLVVVHPDPRDKSDGTLWDALHTAVRGRVAAGGRALAMTPPPAMPPMMAPVVPSIPMQAGPHRQTGPPRPSAPRPSPAELAARRNGNGARRQDDGTPPTEVIPVGAQAVQIDAPTMVIPINRDRTTGKRPGPAVPPRPGTGQPAANGSAATAPQRRARERCTRHRHARQRCRRERHGHERHARHRVGHGRHARHRSRERHADKRHAHRRPGLRGTERLGHHQPGLTTSRHRPGDRQPGPERCGRHRLGRHRSAAAGPVPNGAATIGPAAAGTAADRNAASGRSRTPWAAP